MNRFTDRPTSERTVDVASPIAGSGPGSHDLTPARLNLAILLVVLAGILLVYLLFVRPDAFNEWYAFKPGILVQMAQDTGRLEIQPFQDESAWYRQSANFHSNRWAETLLFVSLSDATGLDMRQLSVAPIGIALYFLALLFLFRSALKGAAGQLAFLLSAGLLLLSWPMLGWVFHSGVWPATVMGLFFLGMLFQRASGQQKHPVLFRAATVLFMIMAFEFYHAVAVILAFLVPTLLAYQASASLFHHRKRPAISTANLSYSNLAIIATAVFFLDPLFSYFLVVREVTRPWEGIESFYVSIFQRAGDVAPFQVGYSLTGRVLLVLPLVGLSLGATALWVRTHLAALLRGRSPGQGEIIAGALFLTAPALLVAGIISGTGSFRYPEAYYLLLATFPLFLAGWLSSHISRGLQLAGVGAAAGLVTLSAVSFFVLAQEPISQWAHLQKSDTTVASWSASRINVPYFADNFTTGLILFGNYNAPIVPLQGATADIEQAISSGPDHFADELRARGAVLALLSHRSTETSADDGVFKTLKTTDFFIPPIPNYDFSNHPYGRIYDDGSTTIITLGSSP